MLFMKRLRTSLEDGEDWAGAVRPSSIKVHSIRKRTKAGHEKDKAKEIRRGARPREDLLFSVSTSPAERDDDERFAEV